MWPIASAFRYGSRPMIGVTASPSVDEGEVERFARMAEEWWDPSGKFRPLHQLNPMRLGFIRSVAAEHFGCDAGCYAPLGD